MLTTFPQSIQTVLNNFFGKLSKLDELGGLTDAKVWRLHFTEQAVIVKQSKASNEVFFYEQIAPHLTAKDIPTPHLHYAEHDVDTTWLIMEDIPQLFSRSRWLVDNEQLAYLRRLHQLDGETWRTERTLFRPQWTVEMTEVALTWFPIAVAKELKPLLESMQQSAQPIFQPTCLISGDPNPLNWGMRMNGTLVQFDWERFGWGTPAIDLAITIPGLGTTEDYLEVASTYMSNAESAESQYLANAIGLAKVWTIVELLCNFVEAHSEQKHNDIIAYLQDDFPDWVGQLHGANLHQMEADWLG